MSTSNLVIPQTAVVLVLADGNFADPKPHTVAEFLKFKPEEVYTHRITTISSLQAIGDSGVVSQDRLRYLIVACLGPMIAGAATVDDGDRADNVGEFIAVEDINNTYFLLNLF
jgi:hypothetical protein